MSDDDRKPTTTGVAPQQAMLDYLDDLLQDATVPQAPVVAPVQPPPAVPVAPAPAAETADVSEAVAERYAAGRAVPGETLPAWFGQDFEVLLFDANGLTLAVPLIELGGILRMPPKLYELANQPDWHLGFMEVEDEPVSVVDTLRWMAPDRVDAAALAPPRYLVRIPDSPWALTCQRLYDAVTMRREDVHWRGTRTSRRWLRGTVREHLCALLDARELGLQLSRDVKGAG